MNPPTHTSRAPSPSASRALYLALFRVTAIADLEGPERAVEWAQSLLDDDQLRVAFVSGAAHERTRAPLGPNVPVIRFGRTEGRRFVNGRMSRD